LTYWEEGLEEAAGVRCAAGAGAGFALGSCDCRGGSATATHEQVISSEAKTKKNGRCAWRQTALAWEKGMQLASRISRVISVIRRRGDIDLASGMNDFVDLHVHILRLQIAGRRLGDVRAGPVQRGL